MISNLMSVNGALTGEDYDKCAFMGCPLQTGFTVNRYL